MPSYFVTVEELVRTTYRVDNSIDEADAQENYLEGYEVWCKSLQEEVVHVEQAPND